MKVQRDELLEAAFVALITAGERMNRNVADFMKQWDVTGPQYNALRILRGADRHGKPSQRIADDMISKVPDVTRLVDRLESAGLAERRTDPDDRRVVRVAITVQGLALLDRIEGPIRDLHEHTLGRYSDAELENIVDLLGGI